MSNASNETASVTQCPQTAVTVSLTVAILLTGVLGNTVVVTYVRRERRAKKKPNLILLFHMALNNLLALCGSLPLHIMLIEFVPRDFLPLRLGNILCTFRPLSCYVFLKVGLLTLTGICVDRYEMFTRMQKPKILTAEFTKKFVAGSWIVGVLSSVVACYGYIQNALRPHVYCRNHPNFDRQTVTVHEKISEVLVIVDVATWIIVCNVIIFYTLLKVWYVLRKHFDTVKNTLGHSKVLREVQLVKMAAYVFGAYAVLWMPYGLARVLQIAVGRGNSTIECFSNVYQTLTYTIFAITPFIYIRTNNKILRETLRMLARPVERLQPHSIVLVAWSTVGRQRAKDSSITSTARDTSNSVEI